MADATWTETPEAPVGGEDPSSLLVEHYAVECELTHGGLGRILVAYDRRLGRRVALKVPIDPEVERQRFAHEVRVTARLQHPSIVPLYEAGKLPSGEPFFAMKLVDGQPLSTVLAGANTPSERLALLPNVIAVADAIAYAHDHGVVHRDLKPSNIVLGTFGETVVLDWGVAHESGSGRDDGVVGTPAYMAPEQAAGAPADPRFDVYAIGALLYHVLSGDSPYRGPDSKDVLRQLAAGMPQPLEQRWPEAPPELVAIVKRAMARAPGQRYPSARELAVDLRQFQTGQLVGAHAYSSWALIRRWGRRHRPTIMVALMLSAALATLGIVSVLRIARAQTEAERQRDTLTLAQARSTLGADPTTALAWLKRYPASGADWPTARTLAADALDSGVAQHSFRHVSLTRVAADGRVILLHGAALVRLWSKGSTRLVEMADAALSALALSRDGAMLATFSRDGTLRMWPVEGGPPRTLWSAHEDGAIVGNAQWSADGKQLAVLAAKNQIWLFSVAGGAPRRFDAGGFVNELALSDDGRWLAAVTSSNVARLWRLDSDGELVLTGHTGEVRALQFARDARRLITASFDGTLRLWDLADGSSRTLKGHDGHVNAVRWLPDGRIASAGDDGTVRLWDDSGASRVLGRHSGGAATAIDVSADGTRVVSGGEDRMVRVWDVAGGEGWALRGHDGVVLDVVLFDEGRQLLSWGLDDVVRIWVLRPPPYRILRRSEGTISSVAWAPPGDRVVTASSDNRILACDPRSDCRVVGSHAAEVLKLVASSDGVTLASASSDGELRLWDLRTGDHRTLVGHTGTMSRLAFSPDGRELLSAGEEGSVWLWTVATGEGHAVVSHADAVMWVGFAPDGALIASAGFDGTVRVRRRDGGVTVLRGNTEWVLAAAFSPDGTRVASAGWDGKVRMWDVPGGAARVIGRHDNAVVAVAFSPDGQLLASGSLDKTVRLWPLGHGAPRILRGHESNLRTIAFAPDGSRLASASDDHTVRIWNVVTGEGRVLRGHQSMVGTIAWSSDGTRIASGSTDQGALLWQLDALLPIPQIPSDAMALFARASTTELVPDEDEPETP
jgi:WD40 repeat protein